MAKLKNYASDPIYLGIAKWNLLLIRDKVDLLGDDTEVVPGIKCVATPGHTPGSVIFMISSARDQLCCIGDLIHFEQDVIGTPLLGIFDGTEEAIKNRILAGLAESGALVFACHLKFPGLGHVTKKDNRLGWQPIDMPI